MTTFKDVADKQLEEKKEQAKTIQISMPYFFKLQAYDMEKSAAFKPITPKATPKEWHDAILWLQLTLKDTRNDASNAVNAMQELLRFTMEAFHTLVDAYEIQGKILIKMAEQLNVDFDEMIADFYSDRKNIALNAKAAEYVSTTPSASKEEAEPQQAAVQEDQSYSSPF